MIPEGNIIGNVERFSGFENDYDKFRPEGPQIVVEILTKYLGGRPSVVGDLGCGTGLSSFIWKDHADRIIGVEPNNDMIKKAKDKLCHLSDASHISFVQGYSNQLDMDSGTVDVITCSQSFHWMEPVSTLNEVSRVLRKDGIFAVYDCDWPPTVNWNIEDQYIRLMDKVDAIIAQLTNENNMTKKWSKEEHLKNMIESKAFRFTKEIVFHNKETCNAERYVGLALSQGGLQSVHKLGSTELNNDIGIFKSNVQSYFRGKTLDVIFSYRMRLGVK